MRLIATGITKSFGERLILNGLDLCAGPGESVAVTGPSGSGKSTLLHILGSLDRPDSGTVRLGAIAVETLSRTQLPAFRATKVGFVFQDHLLLPQLSSLENVLLPTLAAGATDREGRARDLLKRVGLTPRINAYPAQLSGGERQRVAVARALINAPSLLLCDEPTGNLDQHTGETVIKMLLELARVEKTALVIVTHNRDHAALCDHVLTLKEGRLEET
jgi:lipoprotein-releasing system ATP-binding protein